MRNRPRRGELSDASLVAAAIRIAREDGLDRVTMRALAETFGVTQMAAYHYFKSKDQLLQRVVDGIMSLVPVPEPASGPWDSRLSELMVNQLSELSKVRGIGARLPYQRASPVFLNLVRQYLDILREGGLSEDEAFLAFSTIHSYVLGRLLLLDVLRSDPARRVRRILNLSDLGPLHADDYITFWVTTFIDGLKARDAASRNSGDLAGGASAGRSPAVSASLGE